MAKPTISLPITYALDDAALAAAIDRCTDSAIILRRAFHFLIAESAGATGCVFSGELGPATVAALKRLAKRKKLTTADWPDTLGNRPAFLPIELIAHSSPFSTAEVEKWCAHRKTLLTAGRGKGLNGAAKEEVLRDAANICMFHGCGRRLNGIANTPRPGNVGQLAHIVGADPQGPRGREDSHALAGRPGNVMLICYDHHRQIDVIDPESYSIAMLQAMRRQHVEKVNNLLKQLAWPRAKPLIIRGGIAGQVAAITMREVHDALEDLGMTAGESEGEYFHTAPIERSANDYGYQVLNQLKPSIGRLINALQGGHYGPSNDDLAIFPIHDTPVLVLAGRIIGEGRTTHVFQRDRGNKTWRWQQPNATTPDVSFEVRERAVSTQAAPEGLLTVALSDTFQETWIPPCLRKKTDLGQVAWVSIDANAPGYNVVTSPSDQAHLMRGIREALRRLQSDLCASHISMIVVAPASIALGIGQALQAGYHVPVTVFHRTDFSTPFQSALRITARSVDSVDPGSDRHVSVALQ